jgi:Xaa-Pro dipeptidase
MSQDLAKAYAHHVATVQERHERALAACGLDWVVIASGEEQVTFLDDRTYPFKVSPPFNYWVPLVSVAGSYIVAGIGQKPRLIYYQPEDYWYKPPEAPGGFWVDHFDIHVIREPAEAAKLFPTELDRCAWIGENAPTAAIPYLNPGELVHRLHFDRAAKTEYELICMRAATDKAVRGHHAAEIAFRAGGSEYHCHMAYLEAIESTDNELPYQSIVGINKNSAVLHYQHLERRAPQEFHSFLIDAGASFNGYACDITRSYSYADPDFAALVNAMDSMQQALCAEARVGMDYRELHLEAHRRIAGVLHNAGVIRSSPETAFESGVTRSFFPHGLGHLIGLQVHDVSGFQLGPEGGDIPKPEGHGTLRLTRTLAEDFVLTIEPGVYFVDSLLTDLRESDAGDQINWSAVDKFRKFGGIRVEDDIRVLAGGVENLTRDGFDRAG